MLQQTFFFFNLNWPSHQHHNSASRHQHHPPHAHICSVKPVLRCSLIPWDAIDLICPGTWGIPWILSSFFACSFFMSHCICSFPPATKQNSFPTHSDDEWESCGYHIMMTSVLGVPQKFTQLGYIAEFEVCHRILCSCAIFLHLMRNGQVFVTLVHFWSCTNITLLSNNWE